MRLLPPLLLGALLSACGGGDGRAVELPPDRKPPPEEPLPPGVPTPPAPKGVDTSFLTDREKLTHRDLLEALYAPCPDQAVTLAVCVEEERPCRACVPAAQLLAHKVHEGVTRTDGEKIFKGRFGPKLDVPTNDAPTRGDPKARSIVIVWSDPQCPACKRALPEIERALEPLGERVLLVHKLYPLKVHKFGEPAARAAAAAFLQGKFWEMERELFAHQDRAEDADLLEYAKAIKLDVARWSRDRTGAKVDKLLADHRSQADLAGFNGTPFILVNGRHFDLDHFGWKDLRPWIETDLAIDP